MNISKNPFFYYLLTLVFFLTACSGLTHSDKPATKTWWLKPYAGLTKARPPDPLLKIAVSVVAVPGLDTDRVLTLSDNAELNYFATARWADNLPELVTSLVDRTLVASGRFELVSEHTGGGPADCDLNLEVQEFFARLAPPGQATGVQVAIDGRYQCELGAPVFIGLHATIPVNDDRMSVIVAAFQQALDGVLTEMLELL
jgi:cholesterol transport system auxiliary component